MAGSSSSSTASPATSSSGKLFSDKVQNFVIYNTDDYHHTVSRDNQTRTIKNIKFTYSFYIIKTGDNTVELYFHFDSATKTSDNFKYNSKAKSRWIGIKIDGKTLTGNTAPKFPTVAATKKKYHLPTKLAKIKNKEDRINSMESAFNKLAKGKNKRISITGDVKEIVVEFRAFGYWGTLAIPVGITKSSIEGDGTLGQNPDEYENEYLSIASVNNGVPYLINQEVCNEYGWIEKVVDFSDVERASLLKELGETYLSSMQFDDMQISVKALDLHYINKDLPLLKLLDNVRCVSKPHGLDKYFPITEIDIPLDQPDQVTYTMGTTTASGISSSSSSDAQRFAKQISDLPTKSDALNTAKSEVSTLLNQRTQGYVNIIQTDNSGNETDLAQAIVISDTEDWTSANKIWKWDMNGLGYSDKKLSEMTRDEKDAYEALYGQGKAISDSDRWYKLGITSNGTIVADFIKTGILSDGLGRNYWNLQTGEFRLSPTTQIASSNNSSATYGTVANVISMINANSTNIAGNTIKVEKSLSRQYGTYNLLRDTNTYLEFAEDNANGQWANSKWDGNSGYAANKIITNASGRAVPNSAIEKEFYISNKTGHNEGIAEPTFVAQRNVPVSPNQVYVVSFYGRPGRYSGSGEPALIDNVSFYIRVGKSKSNSDGTAGYACAAVPITSSLMSRWKRYTFAFKTSGETWQSADASLNYAGMSNGKVDVMFGFSGSANYLCEIAGMTMERGNTATDWSESKWDTQKYSLNMANQEAKSLYDSLTGSEVFKKILDGTLESGIYLENSKLLIKADYIKSGAMSANYIEAGTLSAKKGTNKWNLDNGILNTDSIVVTGGSIKLGGLSITKDLISFGSNNISNGSWYTKDSKMASTLQLSSDSGITLVSPNIYIFKGTKQQFIKAGDSTTGYAIGSTYYNSKIKMGLNKTLSFKAVSSISSSGKVKTETIKLYIYNGLIVQVDVGNKTHTQNPINPDVLPAEPE